jgi:hypothetical protein
MALSTHMIGYTRYEIVTRLSLTIGFLRKMGVPNNYCVLYLILYLLEATFDDNNRDQINKP